MSDRNVHSDDTDQLTLAAPAKINLTLDVIGRRPDGYHDLRSIMQLLTLHDTLRFANADELLFDCSDRSLQNNNNLVLLAARLLKDVTGCQVGASITLEKRIPVKAGLGGGSSDAATTLMGLNELWSLDLPMASLADLGAQLGSDVPVFFYGPTADISGRGELVRAMASLPPLFVVLGYPPRGVSTGAIFQNMTPNHFSGGGATIALLQSLAGCVLDPQSWPLFNALEPIVTTLNPYVAEAMDHFEAAGAPHRRMTGSGSSVFALFKHEPDAQDVARQLEATNLTVIVTTFATSGIQSAIKG